MADTQPKHSLLSAPPPNSAPPKTYADFQVPPGMSLDADLQDRFKNLARELELSQDGAQRLVDLYAQQLADGQNRHAETRDQWAKQAQCDREFGGSGFDRNIAVARRAIDRFGGDPLRKTLTETGVGNHPEIIRAFWKVGKAISEDHPAQGKAAQKTRDPARLLYPTMFKNKE